MTSPLLPLALHALDHLDQAALKRQAEALIAQVHSEASPEQIASAVQAGWNHVHTPLSAVTPLMGKFRFGWRRPTSLAELSLKQKSTWLDQRFDKFPMAGPIVAGLGVLAVATGLARWVATAVNHSVIIEPGTPGAIAGVLAFVSTLVGAMVGVWLNYDRLFSSRFHVAKRALSQPPSAYLRYPETRDYLRGMLSSPVPDLLEGDVEMLERRYQQCYVADQNAQRVALMAARQEAKTKEQAATQAHLAAQRQTQEANQRKLADLASGLNHLPPSQGD